MTGAVFEDARTDLLLWQARGVDVSPLLGTILRAGHDGLLHGDLDCPVAPSRGTGALVPLALDSRLCVCFDAALHPATHRVVTQVDTLLDVEEFLESLDGSLTVEQLLSAAGAYLRNLDRSVEGPDLAALWRADLVRRFAARIQGLLPPRVSASEEALLFLPRTSFSLPAATAVWLFQYWLPSASLPGMLVRAPREVVERLSEIFGRSLISLHHSAAPLLPGDGPEVLETALALFDPSAAGPFGDLDRVLEVARTV